MTRPPRKPQEPSETAGSRREPFPTASDDSRPFNPLDTKNLAVAVVKALVEKMARPLGSLPVFRGAGIYAIYYRGPFGVYQAISAENRDVDDPRWPIYIGKAIPPGGRRGMFNLEATDTSALYGRLGQHAESIRAVENLDVADFTCRFLVVNDLWIPLSEQLLISWSAPIWNRLIDGFGNHDPGAGRREGLRPRWDVLHPGRAWAAKLKPRRETDADIAREVSNYLVSAAAPSLATLAGDVSAP